MSGEKCESAYLSRCGDAWGVAGSEEEVSEDCDTCDG